MKRTNVVLDEQLLEQARRVTGERTYSGTVNRALAEMVRKDDFWTAYDDFRALGDPHDHWLNYLKEIRPNAYVNAPSRRKPKRVAANERRAPRVRKATRRGTRR
jgi:hypothetical protein